ncbi:hypothetical protein PHYC_02584 [Phycisphaerales bacterium]|nr:hypothetical protein PHYC_02584 [Phycisphaerales bacterium]
MIPSHAPSRSRRGTAYVAVLGLSLLVITIAVGASLAVRSQRSATSLRNDESEARQVGYAGIDWAWHTVASDRAWRDTYKNNVPVGPKEFGRGTMSFKLVDEADGTLSGNALQPVRMYAIGRANNAARGFSIELEPTGPALNVLDLPLYSAGTATVSGTVYASGGPLVCAGLFTVSALSSLNGDIECGSVLRLGGVTGTVKTGVAPRVMPQNTLFDTYAAMGTTITFASIPAGNMTGKLLTSTSNPYGTPCSAGVYVITVPSGSSLTITNCRIQATLVITLNTNSRLVLSGANLWEPPTGAMPTLLAKSSALLLGSVVFNGSLSPLSEATAGTNFNPASSPYGVSVDSDLLDTYPAEIRGLVHITGGSVSITFTNDVSFKGCCIVENSVTVSGGAILTADPQLSKVPPFGYIDPTGVAARAGTWRREPDL